MDWNAIARGMQAGAEEAFVHFSNEVGPWLRRLCLSRGMSGADAESLAVSLISDVALKIDRFEDRGADSFKHWLRTVARNALNDHYARIPDMIHGIDLDALAGPPGVGDDEPAASTALTLAVRDAVEALTLVDRTLIIRRLEEPDVTYMRLGLELDMSEGSARVRHHRALKRLTERLGHDPEVDAWRRKSGLVEEKDAP
jgi:RNA polymerase sigma factor (sigma-70 family)